jgi:AraC-like DNA-binding protein
MLKDTDADVGHIASMLDYADTSAFARAFRRWSGTTPSRWRTRDQGVLTSTKPRLRTG